MRYIIPATQTIRLCVAMFAAALIGTATVHGQGLTPVQQRVVNIASAQNGQSSGRSIYAANGPWITDVGMGEGAGTDGAKMRTAIGRYANWFWTNPRVRPALAVVTAAMVNDLATTAYSPASKADLVNQMIFCYNNASALNPFACVAPPTTQQQTLDFLQCRPTCLEWVDQVAIAAGGQPRSFNGNAVAPAAQRPGMMLVQTSPLGCTHAAIILAINYQGGLPASYIVAEANAAAPFPWSNPPGQRPWQRNVSCGRLILAKDVLRVVSFE